MILAMTRTLTLLSVLSCTLSAMAFALDFNDAGHFRGNWEWDAKQNVVYVSGQYSVAYRGRIK